MIHYISELSVTENLREALRSGENDFPFTVNELNVIEYVNNCAKWHWHEYVEFSYVLEGEVEVSTPRGSFIARAGEGYFINSSVLHMIRMATDTTDAKYRVLQFDADVLGTAGGIVGKYVAPVEKCRSVEAFKLSDRVAEQKTVLSAMTELLVTAETEPPCYELVALRQIAELWIRLYTLLEPMLCDESEHITDTAAARVKTMLAYIHTHYAENMDVDEIAASASVSRREAFRAFRQVLGTTPTLYVLQHRINRAARALMETNMSVTEISAECGFASPSYFSKAFHDLTGVSPREFRRRNWRSSDSVVEHAN